MFDLFSAISPGIFAINATRKGRTSAMTMPRKTKPRTLAIKTNSQSHFYTRTLHFKSTVAGRLDI